MPTNTKQPKTLFYKEVHKYNGRYYSRYDNGYEYKIGETCKAKGGYIYGTDTIENVLKYNYVPFDMTILEMEIIGEYNKNGYIITAKKAKILREITTNEKDNKNRRKMAANGSNAELSDLLQKKRDSILHALQYRN